MFKKIGLLISLLVLGSGLSYGSDGLLTNYGLEASGTLDYYSSYVWRGFTLDDDPVIQPGFNVSGHGFTVSFWGSFDYGNKDGLASDETDFIVDYTKSFGDISVSAGNTVYGFPGGQTYSTELYVGLGLGKLPLDPGIIYYYDNGTGEGSYISVDGSLVISKLNIGLHIGINNELFIIGNGGDYAITLGSEIQLTQKLTFSPAVGYSIPFGDLEDKNDGNQDSKLYGGFSIGF